MHDSPGQHVPRNSAAVEARQAAILAAYTRLGSIGQVAKELKINRKTVRYALDPELAERVRRANLFRYHSKKRAAHDYAF